LPATHVLLYSPRDASEVAVIDRLLNDAAAHMSADAHATGRASSQQKS
jgi:hypothetical protein